MALRIRLLGTLEAEADGVAITLPPGHRVRGLLGWLALYPGPHPRARLAARFWPEVPDSSARASLRCAIWALRGALGPHGSAALLSDRDRIGLRPEGISVDVCEFGRLASAGQLSQAVALCRGELLYELDDDWAFDAREDHAERLAAVLGALASDAGASGQAEQARDLARWRAALRPLDEEAGRDLILRLAQNGDVAGALTAYDRLQQRFRDDLGILPAPETRRLARSVAARSPRAMQPGAGGTRDPASRHGTRPARRVKKRATT